MQRRRVSRERHPASSNIWRQNVMIVPGFPSVTLPVFELRFLPTSAPALLPPVLWPPAWDPFDVPWACRPSPDKPLPSEPPFDLPPDPDPPLPCDPPPPPVAPVDAELAFEFEVDPLEPVPQPPLDAESAAWVAASVAGS